MRIPQMNWEIVSDAANMAQLTGLDAVKLIALIIKLASNALILIERCNNFAGHLRDIGNILEKMKITELMEDDEVVKRIMMRLEAVLKESHVLVQRCQKKRYYLKILSIESRLTQAQAKIDDCMKMIPLINLLEIQRLKEQCVIAREDAEWKENIAAQMAAIQSFRFKQLLDEASEDITNKTNYEDFAKKRGHDQRFKDLDRKERESLLNERVLSLRKALEEKVKAGQDAPIASFKAMLWDRCDINSSSQWSKVKDSLCCNSSYKALKSEDREALFNEHLAELRAAELEWDAERKREEKVAKEYYNQLGVYSCIELFEQCESYDELYALLGSHLSSSADPDIHFKYIEAAAKIGQIKDVERVTRESNFYDADKTKNFLMEARLPDAGPLINVCERFGFVADLAHYLYSNNMLQSIEHYVQKVNPSNAPLVVGQLLDDHCPEDFIERLILSVHFLLPVEPLVEECEKRNRLQLLTQFLVHLESEKSQDVHVYNALGKIIIDTNNNPEHFLTTNLYYDSRVVGKYCEKRDPTLAVVAYTRGHCDDELIDVTNKNDLFKLQARYVVQRMEPELWKKVLDPENQFRKQLIDQVVSTALPESKNPGHVSATVKAFMTSDRSHELTELLQIIVPQDPAFNGNPNLQSLLILSFINVEKSSVIGYINKLNNFEWPTIAEIAVGAELYEEAFTIFKKISLNVQAVNVVLDHIQSFKRAVQFASRVQEDAVWSQVAKAQLMKGLVGDAMESFIHANDATQFLDVIRAAKQASVYQDLVKYLLMVQKKVKEPKVDSELIYAYAKIDRLSDIEEFILTHDVANLQSVGDHLFDEFLFEAAKIIFAFISNWAKLASTLVKLRQFQGAVNAARKANCSKTWTEVCFACVDAEEFRLAQICELNTID